MFNIFATKFKVHYWQNPGCNLQYKNNYCVVDYGFGSYYPFNGAPAVSRPNRYVLLNNNLNWVLSSQTGNWCEIFSSSVIEKFGFIARYFFCLCGDFAYLPTPNLL